MGTPCFEVARGKAQGQEVSLPAYIENALALLDEPGEWYADFAARRVYYKPFAHQTTGSIDAILGTALSQPATVSTAGVSAIVLLPGTHHIEFRRLAFAHLTWLRPSSPFGFVDLNFGFYFLRNVGGPLHGIPGALALHGAHHINVTGCVFTHLGLTGVLTDEGAQDILVDSCHFDDISGCGLSLGNVSEPLEFQDRRLTVFNNTVTNVASEYHGSSGIFAGYISELAIGASELLLSVTFCGCLHTACFV
jgi:hypothetical protein